MESIHSREHSPDRRAFRQMKRLFMLAGILEAEDNCTVGEAANLYRQRVGDEVSDRQIRRDLVLLSDLGVLEEAYEKCDGSRRLEFRYTFEGWPTAIY